MCSPPAESCGLAAKSSRLSSKRLDTRNIKTRRRDGHERWNPSCQDQSRARSGRYLRDVAAELAGPMLSQRLGPMVPPDDTALTLNTALAGDGVVITVSPGVTVERPIHLIFVATGATSASMVTRSLVVMGGGARATLIETHEGP